MNGWELAGVVTALLGVWLTTRENRWCWPVNLVSALLFGVVFWQAKLYADMGLQGVYAALSVYGWYAWAHRDVGGDVLHVSRAPWGVLAAFGAAGVAFAAALGWFLARHTDASLPFWDAGTTSFSLVAQALQTRKWIENWALWIVVDAVYVGVYLVKALPLTAALYGLFIALAALGHVSWRRSLAASAGPGKLRPHSPQA